MGSIGLVVALVFFALMTIAALTSSISMLEVPVAFASESTALSRPAATLVIGGVIFLISATVVFNFGDLFGLVVSFTTEISQPILGILICLFAGWVWHRNQCLAEIQNGLPDAEIGLFWKIWPWYVRVVCPLLIIATFVQTVL
jgi:NSS family neurotransmitter:Na+ symporter